jgi:tight adherence protein C
MNAPLAIPFELTVTAVLWGIFAAGMAIYCGYVAGQITYVTLSDGRRKERRLPFAFRLLLPFAPGLETRFHGERWNRRCAVIDRKLVSAGFDGVLRDTEYLALRLLVPLVFGSLWTGIMALLGTTSGNSLLRQLVLPVSAIGVLAFVLHPWSWLRSAIATRHRSIRRALPFLLDILTLSVEAGLDFMTALQRHVERAEIDALGEELVRVIREVQLGKTRREALRAMSVRVNFADLRTVINALVQADELGVSIGTILRVQSDQIRQRRFERAERLANEAPVKLLFPLLVFIFPAVFLILLGPVLREISVQGF